MGKKWSFEGRVFIDSNFDGEVVNIVKGNGHAYSLIDNLIDFGIPLKSEKPKEHYRITVEEIKEEGG